MTLAKSFGNLKAFEHKVLDFAFHTSKESKATETFETTTNDILKHFSLMHLVKYMRVAKAFKKLNENTIF